MRVELVWSPAAGDVRHAWLDLAPGTRLREALSQLPELTQALGSGTLSMARIGIWGRVQPLDTVLRDRDRIEVYRPLTVDPKEARRQRYRATGQRIISRHRPMGGKTSKSGLE
ncbi:MAG: RnfH family protein [Burkholderiaceae bacterium]|nr:RnfH family protein [Burkholderiaceae bacterium]